MKTDKNVILALVLSVAVLLVFQYLAPKPGTVQKDTAEAPVTDVRSEAEPSGTPAPDAGEPLLEAQAPGTAEAPESQSLAEERDITVDTSLYTAVLSSRGATIKSWRLKQYQDDSGNPLDMVVYKSGMRPLLVVPEGWNKEEAQRLDYTADKDGLVLTEPGSSGEITFVHTGPSGRSILKRVKFTDGLYALEVRVDAQDYSGYRLYMGESFGCLSTRAQKGYGHYGPLSLLDGEMEEDDTEDITGEKTYTAKEGWTSITDKYFFAAISPDEGMNAVIGKGSSDWGYVGVGVEKAKSGGEGFLVYAGPKEYDRLTELDRRLSDSVNFGWFAFIAKPLFVSLKFFYNIVGNYGWAIIIITVIIKLLFAPLTHKSQKSMKRMSKLQPLFAELKEKHKGDPAKLNAEMMELYKKHKVNPLGGCLPMLIQIPVFIALYNVLQNAVELRQAPFMWWLTDLSAKDPYYVLPIAMGLSMLVMQKMTPSSLDPKQNKIMMIMPVALTFMFINLPSGLVLYFTVSNLLSMAQQLYINKFSTEQ